MNLKPPRILSIAGSDSSGGAGIEADIKTATALGAYAMTAVTAVTAQDTTGVYAVELMPPMLVAKQIMACLDDIGADAIKIGMLGSAEIASAVAETLRGVANSIPVVLDPVLASTSGTPLLDQGGIAVLREELIPLAALVTPNFPELERLSPTGHPDGLLALGAAAVLVKGGHGEGEFVTDILYRRDRTSVFQRPRIESSSTHGTGCTLAAAIACGLAEGAPLEAAIKSAGDYVQAAIATAPSLGRGHGPLNHMHGST